MTGIFVLQAAALVVLIGWQSPLGVLAFVVPFGAACGAVTLARASAIADFYGPEHYGSIGGMVGMFVTGARTLAPVGAGAMSAALGGYGPVLWMLVFGSALGASAIYLAQWVGRPVRPKSGMHEYK